MYPTVDEAVRGEACKTGADLLAEYRRIEKLYFA
jgi:hypothetical protein